MHQNDEQVLISENLLNKLTPGNDFRVSEIATIQLRRKTTPTKLYGITF
jgi:hypothetical protein